MARSKIVNETETQTSTSELAQALRDVFEAIKPAEKKNPFNRKVNTPWTPKDGGVKLKLKRKLYQHGLLVDEDKLTNEQIALANKIRPGTYCDGWIRVTRRRDKGIDIDYPIRSVQQRMKLSSVYGIRSFDELLQRIIEEAERPKRSEFDLSADDED